MYFFPIFRPLLQEVQLIFMLNNINIIDKLY